MRWRCLGTGFGIAAVVGIVIGILMGRSSVCRRVLNPYVSFFQATPLIALTPLVVIWTGIGFESEVLITVLLAVWSIIINTAEGVRNTPVTLLDMARVYRCQRTEHRPQRRRAQRHPLHLRWAAHRPGQGA